MSERIALLLAHMVNSAAVALGNKHVTRQNKAHFFFFPSQLSWRVSDILQNFYHYGALADGPSLRSLNHYISVAKAVVK